MPRRAPALSTVFLAILVVGFSTSVLAAEPAIKKADRVKVTKGPAPILRGRRVLTTVETGTELTALEVDGEWVGVRVRKDGKQIKGWIHRKHVSAVVAPAAPPEREPREEKDKKLPSFTSAQLDQLLSKAALAIVANPKGFDRPLLVQTIKGTNYHYQADGTATAKTKVYNRVYGPDKLPERLALQTASGPLPVESWWRWQVETVGGRPTCARPVDYVRIRFLSDVILDGARIKSGTRVRRKNARWLPGSRREGPPQKQGAKPEEAVDIEWLKEPVEEMLSIMTELVTALRTVKDRASAQAATRRVADLHKRKQSLAEQVDAMAEPAKRESKQLMELYGKRFESAAKGLADEYERIMKDGALKAVLEESLKAAGIDTLVP